MFDLEATFRFFTQYNLSVWPMQIVDYVLSVVILFAAVKKVKYSDQIIAAILAFFWIWTAIMFWPPAGVVLPLVPVLAALAFIQGALFLMSIWRPIVSYRFGTDSFSLTGLALVAFGLIVYPLIGYSVGHTYPQSLTVGVFPCPTTILTLGLFLCTAGKVPKYLIVIPGFFAIMLGLSNLYVILGPSGGIVEDIGLLLSGLIAIPVLIYRDRAAAPTSVLRPAG
ncbi:MAG: DUF6064 family protein [Chloroflexi bacterium]|nr:DUF6064 family protein [Chloroflexota bacterium]